VFEYELDVPMALYGSIPVMLAHWSNKGNAHTAGVFWFNPSETFVDIEDTESTKHTHWMSESGIFDLFLMRGPSAPDVLKQYTSLTGTQAMPPMFAIGYHQCRWNYRDEPDVYNVDEEFERHDFPYDVLWLDIEHTDRKKYFTWDKQKFPEPIAMQQSLAARGHKMVTIVDPHISSSRGYHVHDIASKEGFYIKKKNGNEDFDGWCWPGKSHYLDFTSSKVRNFWAEQFAFDKYDGSTESL
jgi:mannosyl-oligosaccharide alpha-1,3-glucosidase